MLLGIPCFSNPEGKCRKSKVGGAANQPNVFYDPSSIDSGFPRKSNKQTDFNAQSDIIEATEEYWTERNNLSSNQGLIPERYVYCIDARPYPIFPNRKDVWEDAPNYEKGHWIAGKVDNIIYDDQC